MMSVNTTQWCSVFVAFPATMFLCSTSQHDAHDGMPQYDERCDFDILFATLSYVSGCHLVEKNHCLILGSAMELHFLGCKHNDIDEVRDTSNLKRRVRGQFGRQRAKRKNKTELAYDTTINQTYVYV
jgi:hypothetical protein